MKAFKKISLVILFSSFMFVCMFLSNYFWIKDKIDNTYILNTVIFALIMGLFLVFGFPIINNYFNKVFISKR